MNTRLDICALIPTFAVALVLLARDASFYSFATKVFGTYVFFWFLTVAFLRLWRIVTRRAATRETDASARQARPNQEGDVRSA